MSSLRVTIDHNVRARTFLVEGSDLRDTITSALGNLVAVVTTQGNVELDINVIAAFALVSQLAARRLDKGERATVMVWRVVAASHEDDYISASCVELRSYGLRNGESREGAQGQGVAHVERHD
jgi:hypothetical protein